MNFREIIGMMIFVTGMHYYLPADTLWEIVFTGVIVLIGCVVAHWECLQKDKSKEKKK